MDRRSSRAKLLREACYGVTVAKDNRVQHGFTDSTHNACCLLGPKSRDAADASGNEIGQLSMSVRDKTPFLNSTAMTPWTTCMGSAVCSAYGEKYGDSFLQFAVSPDKSLVYMPAHGTQLPQACEHFLQETVFKGSKHRTPGVAAKAKGEDCSTRDRASVLADVKPASFLDEEETKNARSYLAELRKALEKKSTDP